MPNGCSYCGRRWLCGGAPLAGLSGLWWLDPAGNTRGHVEAMVIWSRAELVIGDVVCYWARGILS